MKKEDIKFRKDCQKYGNKINQLLKNGSYKEASELIVNIEKSLREWEDVIKSARFKTNTLKSLLVKAVSEERRFSKLNWRQ